MALNDHDQMREVKMLMAGIEGRLANDDVFTIRRTIDELVLAMNLLVGLVENHRHSIDVDYSGERIYSGPMQAMEGRRPPSGQTTDMGPGGLR